MTAKELVEAAERMNEEWNINRIASEDLQAVVNHILATVRPDDDEPVTRERMKSEPGWAEHPDYPWRFDHAITGCVVVSETNSRWKLVEPHRILKSMGHLRRLVAALGE